ncbi:hypothetical protein C0Q70_00068 [Pomacea canaliculata]|uniref:Uncharacterized protein n=1 Tax=Pomacea canaliculata TaxID=400727 RepID=A0A2T7PVN4_POMCA|nr:hypothetical protein C0Q70_00068 [Pomacea canaliculata]
MMSLARLRRRQADDEDQSCAREKFSRSVQPIERLLTLTTALGDASASPPDRCSNDFLLAPYRNAARPALDSSVCQ